MKVEKYSENQRENLKVFLKSSCIKEPPWYFLDQECVLLAKKNNKIIGVAGYRKSELHNKVFHIEIVIEPNHRRERIGSSLHSEILNAFSSPEDLIGYDGCCYSDDTLAQFFLTSLGYEKYLDSHCLILDLSKSYSAIKLNTIVTLKELYLDITFKKKIREFYISRYFEEHSMNPSIEEDDDVWNDYYQDGTRVDLGVAMLLGKDIIGCSFAYEGIGEEIIGENDNLMGIGPGYIKSQDDVYDQLSLSKSLLAHQFELLRNNGIIEVYFELDSTESISTELLKWLPIKRSKIFERYRLKR